MISDTYIVIRNLVIQNANAFSSAFTIGFPAMTAWLGAVHAMQRKINEFSDYKELKFEQAAVACHEFMLHTYKGRGDFDWSVSATANPATKDGKRPPFIEEARCNLCVSLMIGCKNFDAFACDDFKEVFANIIHSKMKVAGGDILSFEKIEIEYPNSDQDKKKLLNSLMPAYMLIERKDLAEEAMNNGSDALDAILDYSALNYQCEKNDSGHSWVTKRKSKGWIVPIAVGFQGISALTEPGITCCQRDSAMPHRFAEAVVTLGEFKMPFRIKSFETVFWHYDYREKENLYLCVNDKGE